MDEQSTKGPGSIQQKGLKEIAYDDWIIVILHTLFKYSCYLNFGIQCWRCKSLDCANFKEFLSWKMYFFISLRSLFIMPTNAPSTKYEKVEKKFKIFSFPRVAALTRAGRILLYFFLLFIVMSASFLNVGKASLHKS